MRKHTQIYLLLALLLGYCSLQAQFETRLTITDGMHNQKLKETIERNVSAFLSECNSAAIRDKKPDLNKNETTADARKRFSAIWSTSPISCPVSNIERACLIRSNGGYQIRPIPVIMLEASFDEQQQEIAINLTADGLIDDVFISINQYMDILNSNLEEEDIDRRFMVLDFVENFRTSYNRKDISFLEMVFSDNAIIIVGKEIKVKKNTDSGHLFQQGARIEYQVKTKKEYIASMKRIFTNNKYIDINFDEVLVLQHENYKEVYGVTLKQEWNSSTYSDSGYVFLLIDFRDEDNPVIHVRTWQPEKFDGRLLSQDEIFQIGDFDLNRF